MSTTTTPMPNAAYTASKQYSVYNELRDAGWKRNFDLSAGGHLCLPIDGAPSLGGSPGGLLYFGAWTAPDGTSLIQRSNMDRSVSTMLLDPYGRQLEFFISKTLIESADRIRDLDLI